MTRNSLDIRPVAGALGAEITGVDLSEDLDGDKIAEIGALGSTISRSSSAASSCRERFLAFARRFGEVVEYPFLRGRRAQHNPINDYHGHRRVMHRVTLAGDQAR